MDGRAQQRILQVTASCKLRLHNSTGGMPVSAGIGPQFGGLNYLLGQSWGGLRAAACGQKHTSQPVTATRQAFVTEGLKHVNKA